MQTKAAPLPFVIPTGVEGSQVQQTLREMDYRSLFGPQPSVVIPTGALAQWRDRLFDLIRSLSRRLHAQVAGILLVQRLVF